MSVGSIIAGGLRLVRTRPQAVAIWAAAYLCTTLVSMVILSPRLAPMMAQQRHIAAWAGPGAPTPPAPAAIYQLLPFELLLLIVMAVLFAAASRAVFRPEEARFGYLRLGKDELRLIGLGVLLALAAAAAEVVVGLAIILTGAATATVASKAAGIAVGLVLLLLALCGVLYVQVRISLAFPLTVLRRRIVIREAWQATRGRFWTLLGVFVVLFLATMLVGIVLVGISDPGMLAAYASMDPAAVNAAAQAQLERQAAGLSVAMVAQAILGAVVSSAFFAVVVGSLATATLEFAGRAPSAD